MWTTLPRIQTVMEKESDRSLDKAELQNLQKHVLKKHQEKKLVLVQAREREAKENSCVWGNSGKILICTYQLTQFIHYKVRRRCAVIAKCIYSWGRKAGSVPQHVS